MKKNILSILLGIMYLSPASAHVRIKAENREYAYDAGLPTCEDASVTTLIAKRFAAREADTWKTNLTIHEIKQIKSRGFRPNGVDLIPRRYCTASVMLSDQKKRQLDYVIIEDAGIIGWNYGVEWCVSGLDRSYAYGGHCKSARP